MEENFTYEEGHYYHIDVEDILNAPVTRCNKNSIIIQYFSHDVFVSHSVWNRLYENREFMPTFLIMREYKGTKTLWVAIPKTI